MTGCTFRRVLDIEMKWIAAGILIFLLVACTTFLPITSKDEAEIEKLLCLYTLRWGPWDVFQANYTTEKEGWIGFLWINKEYGGIIRAVFLAYLNGQWFIFKVVE